MSSSPIGLPHLTRRAVLAVLALPVDCRRASAGNSADMVAQIIDIATNAGMMTLAPAELLRRVAFRGGTPTGQEGATSATYYLRDGMRTLGHIVSTRRPTGWRLDLLMLLFGIDDAIPLDPLRDAFSKYFGVSPRDQTMSPRSNTVLQWRGSDRSVRISAGVPGDGAQLVYVVTIARP